MRMLCWMCGKNRRDWLKNKSIGKRVELEPIILKMLETRIK